MSLCLQTDTLPSLPPTHRLSPTTAAAVGTTPAGMTLTALGLSTSKNFLFSDTIGCGDPLRSLPLPLPLLLLLLLLGAVTVLDLLLPPLALLALLFSLGLAVPLLLTLLLLGVVAVLVVVPVATVAAALFMLKALFPATAAGPEFVADAGRRLFLRL